MATHLWLIEPFKKTTRKSHDDPKIQKILASYFPNTFALAITDEGKPYSKNHKEMDFNISHSRGLAVLAISKKGTIGVDVEFLKPRKKWQSIARKYFSPNEQAVHHFYHAFTAREAFSKALGLPLAKTISRTCVSYQKNHVEIGLDEVLSHRVDFFMPTNAYLIALCRPKEFAHNKPVIKLAKP